MFYLFSNSQVDFHFIILLFSYYIIISKKMNQNKNKTPNKPQQQQKRTTSPISNNYKARITTNLFLNAIAAKDNLAIASTAPTTLIAPSDYEHLYSVDNKKNRSSSDNKREEAKSPTSSPSSTTMATSKNMNRKQPKLPKVPSDAPTALIAPSDYQHYFTNKKHGKNSSDFVQNSFNIKYEKNVINKQQMKKAGEIELIIKKIPSDAPTTLIAPSDYEHLYSKKKPNKSLKNTRIRVDNNMMKKTTQGSLKIPSDAPTVLVAPSDYQNLFTYKDNTNFAKWNKTITSTKQANRSKSPFYYKIKQQQKQMKNFVDNGESKSSNINQK